MGWGGREEGFVGAEDMGCISLRLFMWFRTFGCEFLEGMALGCSGVFISIH